MLTPLIEYYRSDRSPWDVYQSMAHASRTSFFLDSHNYQPPNQKYSYFGANPLLEVKIGGDKVYVEGSKKVNYPVSQLFTVLRNLLKENQAQQKKSYPFFTGGLIGYWGYELTPLFEEIQLLERPGVGIPKLHLGLYRDLVVYDHKEKVYWLVAHADSSEDRSTEAIQKLKTYFQPSEKPTSSRVGLKRFQADVSKRDFEKMVIKTKNYIAAGDIYQANLSQRFSFEYDHNPFKLYETLRTINPSPFASFLKFNDVSIVSSSPERLVQKRGDRCQTQPIAGTRPRKSLGRTEDDLERELIQNEKERAEHLMLVDLERNDLGRVCDWPTVRVTEFMNTEKYSHVIHLVSKIEGRLRKDKDAFDLIQAMFPGGTITGCPKIRCMQIINELEPVERSIYTGSIGYIDFNGDLDLNIVIRTVLLIKNQGYFQVGAGIVHDSDPSREYEETLHKGEALAEALAQSSL